MNIDNSENIDNIVTACQKLCEKYNHTFEGGYTNLEHGTVYEYKIRNCAGEVIAYINRTYVTSLLISTLYFYEIID